MLSKDLNSYDDSFKLVKVGARDTNPCWPLIVQVNNPGLICAKEGIANGCILPSSGPELTIGKHDLASLEISQRKKSILFLLPLGDPSGLPAQVPPESIETKVVSKPRWLTADTLTGLKE